MSSQLKKIGYWFSEREPHLPRPEAVAWDTNERAHVLVHLHSGKVLISYRGMSRCRVCEEYCGSQCLTDGVYQWPSGLEHYVAVHDTGLPREFVEHVLAGVGSNQTR